MKIIEGKIINLLNSSKAGLRSSDIAKKIKTSKVTILRHLSDLETDGIVIRFSNGPRTWYMTKNSKDSLIKGGLKFWKIYKNKELEEQTALDEIEKYLLNKIGLSDQAKSIFGFSFAEMMNNAIEHSRSKRIRVEVFVQDRLLVCSIEDYGIGAFANIRTKNKLPSEIEAAREVLKGKITTEEKNHTGQGIFFTSRMTDQFVLKSHKHAIVVKNEKKPTIVIDSLKTHTRGTLVLFTINRKTHRHTSTIFSKYAETEVGGFNTTEVHVKLYTKADYLVSRSQALRIVANLEKFSKVILDFTGVKNIGQGFSDEIFRVFANKHQEIELHPINMNNDVKFMIERAKNIR
ncbi:MAG: DUF4325 domain-containing protein [Patescibacteria group bacterium]